MLVRGFVTRGLGIARQADCGREDQFPPRLGGGRTYSKLSRAPRGGSVGGDCPKSPLASLALDFSWRIWSVIFPSVIYLLGLYGNTMRLC